MNTQQRAILSKARRLLAMDAEWDESKHPRAENGQFGSGRPSENKLDERGKVNFPELSGSEIAGLAKVPIGVHKEMKQGERKAVVKEWLRANLQGKSVTASDGNKIHFTRNDTVSHIAFNSQRSNLIAECVPHLADVFATGKAIGFQESSHTRKDTSIIGFQVYRKEVELAGGYKVYLEAHAAKRKNGDLEFAAYTLKKAVNSHSSTDIAADSTRIPDSLFTADINHTPAADSVQLFRILKITDLRRKVVAKPATTVSKNLDRRLADKKKGNRSSADDSGEAVRHVEYGLPSADNHTPTQNQMQGCELFRILKITDPKGNDVSKTYDETITDKNGRDVTETYAEGRLSLAQDRSLRSYDQDGRLHVETSNISKATVNPYYGSEIPNYRQLGLDPKKVYYLLRDPEELEKAAPTFNNLPLLNKHIPVSADEPQKDVIVGTTGSDAKFEDGYLKCSLAVWDSEAIAGIESGEQMELSSAYRYVADMTPGEFNGMRYDGVMRDIVGNHVALVDVGRAGSDVVVSDADPFCERTVMKLKAGAKARIQAAVQPLLAQDAELSPDELLQVIGSLTNEVQTAEDDGEELPSEDAEEVGTDEDETAEDEDVESESEEVAADEDETNESEQPKEQPAQAQDRAMMKIAMDKAIAKAVAAERKRAQALAQAQRDVAHLVGDVAMDSAEDVYKFALEQHGVDVAGVHPSAYRAMVGLIGKSKGGIAMDSANSASKQFKGLDRIRKG